MQIVRVKDRIAAAVYVVNQEASLADEVVVIFVESLRSRESHGVADVAKSVIAVSLQIVGVIPGLRDQTWVTQPTAYSKTSNSKSWQLSEKC